MQFRVLGPLTVENDRGPVALGGPKPRALLAALLVEAGRVVSADRLVVALWGESPPPGAVSALRAYASRLRGALGAGERLATIAPSSSRWTRISLAVGQGCRRRPCPSDR